MRSAARCRALRGEIRVLDQKIVTLDQQIDGVDSRLNTRIDALAAQMTSLQGRDGFASG